MSFIFIVFIVVFVLFFFNNRYQIKLFEQGFTQTYYQNTTKTLEISTDSMAASLGALVKGMDENDQIKVIKKAIDDYRFGPNKDGYYFVARGTILLVHPEAKLVDTDVGSIQDSNGVYLFQKLDEAALKGGGIVKYMWPKYKSDGTSQPTPKNSYATLIPNTNGMYISTGVYTDDLQSSTNTLTAPIKQKMEYSFWTNLVITFIILLVCSIIAGTLFYKYIFGSMAAIKETISSFFEHVRNNDVLKMKIVNLKLKDEFAEIANAINSNIRARQESLSKDSIAVSQALEVAKTIEEGNLSIRITKNPANPQLLELKDVLNNMLDVLETKIGSNMNEIERVFDSYLRLDFSTSVLDDKGNIANKGSVERVTNALGEEIRKMLKSSLSFASLLNEEAKKLNTQITNLSTSSNAQASSLEQSATAIEEITQSMQN
ncbi:hypothetical protein BKH40_08185, partial [Helicobacter sp. 11S02629-2]